ncbi:MAG TPA: Hsp20/alpha crystallin family protein [Bacteroidia bacterium]|nr:Hsp20/alpha crystallin family protein [Bacteroidia bacterium]
MFSLTKTNNDRNRLFTDFPLLFDDAFSKNFFEKQNRILNVPAVNIKETDKSFELDLAVPGMDKKDFKIELKDGSITISAKHENKVEETNEKERYSRREFSYQSFSRSFVLAEDLVDTEGINAKYENGILNVSIPKKTNTQIKLSREIQIS